MEVVADGSESRVRDSIRVVRGIFFSSPSCRPIYIVIEVWITDVKFIWIDSDDGSCPYLSVWALLLQCLTTCETMGEIIVKRETDQQEW
jgi:hypothetical protein